MPLVIVLVVVLAIVIVWMAFWLTFNLFHLALYLLVAGLVGWLADVIVPGRLPWGWLGAIVAGIVGGWIGVLILGRMGPNIFGVYIIPALVGAIVLAFIANLLAKRSRRI